MMFLNILQDTGPLQEGKKNLFQNFIVLMLRNHDVPQSHIYYIPEKILGIEK